MPEISLDRSSIVTVIGELIATGMPQHVSMGFDAKLSHRNCPLDRARKARSP